MGVSLRKLEQTRVWISKLFMEKALGRKIEIGGVEPSYPHILLGEPRGACISQSNVLVQANNASAVVCRSATIEGQQMHVPF